MVNYNKTEYVYVSGKTFGFNAQVTNKWNKWTHKLYPDAESLKILLDLQAQGLKNKISKDDDGSYIFLSRPASKQTLTGKVLVFQPPKVFDNTGAPFNGNVGNGSDVTTKLEIYSYNPPGGGPAKAMRWESSRIDNLVPFDPERDMTDEEKKAADGLTNLPPKDFF